MDGICRAIVLSLHDLFSECNSDGGHGVEHALKVYRHAENALAVDRSIRKPLHIQAIKYACLLHDADDKKFFNTKNNQNTRDILSRVCPGKTALHNLVVKMIELVSCSTNGNSTEGIAEDEMWMLIPRLCDRLEAIGEIGILRAWYYSKHTGRPLSLPSTRLCRTEEELHSIVTPARFIRYMKKKDSASMIDHFYDKVLHIGTDEVMGVVKNPYILSEARRRRQVVINYVLEFGRTGVVDVRRLNKMKYNYKKN